MLTLGSTFLLLLLLLLLLLQSCGGITTNTASFRFCDGVRRKQIKIDESSWPTFMYDDYDPDHEDIGEGFTRGYYLMKVSTLPP